MDFSYTYDAAGNILTATKGGTTYSYTYGNSDWGDLLTAYNGASITYDGIGNPLSYYNGWNFTWKQGREMATATKGSQSLSFTYDADGIRKTKTVNGVVHTYYYSGGKLARETYGSNVQDFFYDQNGHPFMLVYNGTVYYYITNAQGDVIRLTDVKGQTAARYQYDPYGNIIDSAGSHVDINPLRYRGYYFDSETSLYYLLTRYYDPNIGRFINADAYIATDTEILGLNMYAYCINNPVCLFDPTGTYSISLPTLDKGLNLPAGEGTPMSIGGETYYYYSEVQRGGYTYEYWYDANGNLIHIRHNTDHKQPWAHEDPHDHKGGKDKDGYNTIIKTPLKKDDNFKSPPKAMESPMSLGTYVRNATAGVAVGYVVYQVIKWAVAGFFAPSTGGASLGIAGTLP